MSYEGLVSSSGNENEFQKKRFPAFGQSNVGMGNVFGQTQNPNNATHQPFNQPAFGQVPSYSPFNAQQSPFQQASFGQAPFGQAPFGQAPFGQTINNQVNTTSAFNPPPSAFSPSFGMNAAPQQFEPNKFGMLGDKSSEKHQNSNSQVGLAKKERKPKEKKREPRKPKQTPSQKKLEPPVFQPVKFQTNARPPSNSAAILRPLPKPLTSVNIKPDLWDIENQNRMRKIEQDYLSNKQSLQTSYEIMSQMRKNERSEMEQRGLVDNTNLRKDLTDAIEFVGSCSDMCPVFERVRRAHENNVLSLEKNSLNQVSKDLAVKAFSRPAAGQPPPLPSDVRPPQILVQTLQYLVQQVLPKLPQSHPFLWDRTRSIRQDFTYQNYQGPEALYCFEVIARIHCLCLHLMARAVSQDDVEWSQQQELEQFNKCLQSLAEFYQVQDQSFSIQAEMCSYQLISQFFDNELESNIDRLAPEISRHKFVNLAVELRSLARISVAMFFKRVRQADVPVTLRAIAEVHYNRLRVSAVRALLTSLHPRTNMYPFLRFVDLLGFENPDEARQFCNFYDLIISVSDENGEEIDLKSWSESNVKDKQQMPQSFDSLLDSRLSEINVLVPLDASNLSTGSFVDRKINATGQPRDLSRSKQPELLDSTIPKISPLPEISSSLPETNIEETSQLDLLRQKEQLEKDAQQRAKHEEMLNMQRLEQQKLKLKQELERKKEAERIKQQKLEHEKELERQNAQARELELQKQHKERQIQLRVEQRAQFIDVVSLDLIRKLIESTAATDFTSMISSVMHSNKILLRKICKRIHFVAECALDRQKEQISRTQEVLQFREKRGRVVSNRRIKSALSLTNNSLSSNESSISGVPGRKDLSTSDYSNALDYALNFGPLRSAMRKAYSCGLRTLRVSADPKTPQGKWLYAVMKVGQSVEINPGEYLEIDDKIHALEHDVVLIGQGGDEPSQGTYLSCQIFEESLRNLTAAIQKLLAQFVETELSKLNSHKSLITKRRRLSTPTKPLRSSQTLTQPQPPRLSYPSAEERLRLAIENTHKLLQD